MLPGGLWLVIGAVGMALCYLGYFWGDRLAFGKPIVAKILTNGIVLVGAFLAALAVIALMGSD